MRVTIKKAKNYDFGYVKRDTWFFHIWVDNELVHGGLAGFTKEEAIQTQNNLKKKYKSVTILGCSYIYT